LTQRTTAAEQPYRIIAMIVDPNDFDLPLVIENHANMFVVCNGEKPERLIVTENSTHTCVFENKDTAYYIVGILNSRLMDFYFRLFNSNTHVSSRELNALPIIDTSGKQRKKLIDLVKRRLHGEYVDEKIDAIVYKLYGLTDDEIKIIQRE
jgi:hypothetical protein